MDNVAVTLHDLVAVTCLGVRLLQDLVHPPQPSHNEQKFMAILDGID